ncbi:MAG: ABC transporter permease [Bacteroidota bacterium]|nr:ABC transporter permease [Bacteroidota bacterium]
MGLDLSDLHKRKQHISANPDTPVFYLTRSLSNAGLAFSLAGSEIKGRHAQTWLGYFISLIQILLATSIYWLIFGIILNVDTGNIPFPLFVLTGLIPWVYFSGLVQEAGNSLISSQHLITKIYFPRVILPFSKALPGLLDFFIAFAVALVFILICQMPLRVEMIAVPLFLLILIFSGLAIGLWISSLSVRFRDLSRLIPFLINFGFFMTPVFYPSTIVPAKLEFILFINPAAFAIEGMRWAMFGTNFPEIYYLISLIPMIILFLWGWHNFRKNEKKYADII